MALQPGSRLGAYEIVSLLGAGGMGEVYRASDTRLNRDVAVKILPAAFATDAERLARFKREAQVLASLNHPHIAAIYGLEETPNGNALILELVDGPTLADRIAQGPIPVDDALPIAKQIAEALEAAHERGIIHRDLKPANIKLTPDGSVKVLDFGLAKATGELARGNASLSPTITSPAVTMGGVLLGSAAYMSPEQAKGREADKRSDVWGFGCVLYEMLSGKRAFDGEDLTETIAAVVKSEPDWSVLPADVPEQIRLLIRRCLEKDRGRRISDISIARFLMVEPILAGATHGAPATMATAAVRRPAWRRALPALAFAIVASALAGAAAWKFKPSPPLTVTRFTYLLGSGQEFTNAGRHIIAISPDGSQLVYVANRRLYLKSAWEAEATAIAGTEAAQVTTPVFSPDGESIAFYTGAGAAGAGGSLKKIGRSGGAAVTLCQASNPLGMSWDGDTILFGQTGKGILRVSANGGTPDVIVGVTGDEVAHGPQMLTGGRALLYTLANGTDWDNARIVVQAPGSSDRKVLITGSADARYLPTGHIIYALGSVVFAVRFDVGRLEVVGGPVPVVEGVRRVSGGTGGNPGTAHFAVSPTGSLAFIEGPSTASGSDVALLDRKGTLQLLKLPPRAYAYPRVSPDGRQLAVGVDDGKEVNVWIHDLSGTSAIRRLTFGGNNRYPIWTSDGARIAFQSDREGDRAIFSQAADGNGAAERITKPEEGQAHIPQAWSPSGDSFLFSVVSGSNQSLWTFALQDKKAAPFGSVRFSSLAGPNAALSSNGRWVAYASAEPGRSVVFVEPYPATGAKYQIADGTSALWSRDGTELFLSPGQGGGFLIIRVTSRPTFTFENPMSVPRPGYVGRLDARNWDITPAGERFVIVLDPGSTATAGRPEIQFVLNWFEELKRRVPVK